MQSTEHYGYRLPQLGENARVTDLNFNATKIDNVEYNTRRMIAPLHDINATYNTGDKVEEDGELCICKEDNVTGAFDPTQWDVKPVTELLDGVGSKIVYSTTEQEIGTWIDGNPLYQITIEKTMGSVGFINIDVSGLNIAQMVSMSGIFQMQYSNTVSIWYPFNYFSANNFKGYLEYSDLTNKIRMEIQGSGYTTPKQYIILQYTKST